LEAVLYDIDQRGDEIDSFWLLGGHAAMGPDPVGAVQLLQSLPKNQAIRGNTDRLVLHWTFENRKISLQKAG